MSKATESLDITVSAGILAVIGLVSFGGIFASASPAVAPETSVTSAVHSNNDNSGLVTVSSSGGRLQK